MTFAQFPYALTLKVLLYLKNDKIFYCNIKIKLQYFKPHKINWCVIGENNNEGNKLAIQFCHLSPVSQLYNQDPGVNGLMLF